MNRRRSLVIVISDFIQEGIDRNLINLASQHDLVCIHIQDDLETNLPKLGIIPVYDLEGKKKSWINTSFGEFSGVSSRKIAENKEHLEELGRKHQFEFVSINTREDFVPVLIQLFKTRNKIMKRG